MICEETLALERQERLEKYQNKLNDIFETKKTCLLNKANKDIEEYKLNHNEEEIKQYEFIVNQETQVAISNLENKHRKKYQHRQKFLEKRSKEVLSSGKRIWEIDLLRGIAIWGMMIDHYVYDFYELFPQFIPNWNKGWLHNFNDFASKYWVHDFRVFVRLFGVFLFVFLCGISCKFAKSNIKRGLMILGLGGVVTVALGIVSAVLKDPSLQIMLSTLTTIGLCILIYSGVSILCRKLFGKQNWKWICLGIALSLLIFWGFFCSIHYLQQGGSSERLIKRFFYIFNNNGNDVGWINSGFQSLTAENWWWPVIGLKGFGADWLGLFPYTGYIFLGGFVGETVYADRKSLIKYHYKKEDRLLTGNDFLKSPMGQLNSKLNVRLSGISYPGRHTLLVYILHQPVFIAIMIPIFLLSGYTISL